MARSGDRGHKVTQKVSLCWGKTDARVCWVPAGGSLTPALDAARGGQRSLDSRDGESQRALPQAPGGLQSLWAPSGALHLPPPLHREPRGTAVPLAEAPANRSPGLLAVNPGDSEAEERRQDGRRAPANKAQVQTAGVQSAQQVAAQTPRSRAADPELLEVPAAEQLGGQTDLQGGLSARVSGPWEREICELPGRIKTGHIPKISQRSVFQL